MHGACILDRRIIDFPDVRDFPTEFGAASENFLSSGYRAITIVPMVSGDVAIGALSVVRVAPGPLSDKQVSLLKTFADQAVIAIENARLFEEVQARNRDLTALSEVGRAVSSTLDLKAVLKTIVERAVELSTTDAGSIFYYRDGIGKFELEETAGLYEEVVARFRTIDIAARDTAAPADRGPQQGTRQCFARSCD
jgi:two-component system, NtrC family, sensor kinase